MAEFDPQATVDDAIGAVARGMVKKTKDGEQEVEYFSPDELKKGRLQETSKSHFGIKMTKLIPPGTG